MSSQNSPLVKRLPGSTPASPRFKGLPKASSVLRDKRILSHDISELGLFDITVDDGTAEIDSCTRSIRFASAAARLDSMLSPCSKNNKSDVCHGTSPANTIKESSVLHTEPITPSSLDPTSPSSRVKDLIAIFEAADSDSQNKDPFSRPTHASSGEVRRGLTQGTFIRKDSAAIPSKSSSELPMAGYNEVKLMAQTQTPRETVTELNTYRQKKGVSPSQPINKVSGKITPNVDTKKRIDGQKRGGKKKVTSRGTQTNKQGATKKTSLRLDMSALLQAGEGQGQEINPTVFQTQSMPNETGISPARQPHRGAQSTRNLMRGRSAKNEQNVFSSLRRAFDLGRLRSSRHNQQQRTGTTTNRAGENPDNLRSQDQSTKPHLHNFARSSRGVGPQNSIQGRLKELKNLVFASNPRSAGRDNSESRTTEEADNSSRFEQRTANEVSAGPESPVYENQETKTYSGVSDGDSTNSPTGISAVLNLFGRPFSKTSQTRG